jgi:hypothetical protein
MVMHGREDLSPEGGTLEAGVGLGGARGGQLMGFLQITPFSKIGENRHHRVKSGQKIDYLRDLNNSHQKSPLGLVLSIYPSLPQD